MTTYENTLNNEPLSSNIPGATHTHICPTDVEGEEAELDSHPTHRVA